MNGVLIHWSDEYMIRNISVYTQIGVATSRVQRSSKKLSCQHFHPEIPALWPLRKINFFFNFSVCDFIIYCSYFTYQYYKNLICTFFKPFSAYLRYSCSVHSSSHLLFLWNLSLGENYHMSYISLIFVKVYVNTKSHTC